MFIDHEARSYNPAPGVDFDKDRPLFAEVKSIARDCLAVCTPGCGAYRSYMKRAANNRLMVQSGNCAEWFHVPLPKRSMKRHQPVSVTPPEQSRAEQSRTDTEQTPSAVFGLIDLLPVVAKAVANLKSKLPFWADVEDMKSLALIEILEHGEPMTEALAYLIAKRSLIDWARKEQLRRKGRQESGVRDTSPGSDPSPEAENIPEYRATAAADVFARIWEAVKALPDRQREAMILAYWGGQDTRESGALMGVTDRAVQGLLAKGQVSLKKILDDVRFQGASNDKVDVEWFRVYVSMKDDPKVQLLPADLFMFLVNIWCVARQNDGVLPKSDVLAFQLRKTEAQVNEHLKELVRCGLIDKTAAGLMPHNWNTLQYSSDSSTSRVKRHREKSSTLPKRSMKLVSVDELAEWRCFLFWVSGGLNPMDGSMAAEVRDSLDMRCPGFLEAETEYFTGLHGAGESYDWPLDFLSGLVDWIYRGIFSGREVPPYASLTPTLTSKYLAATGSGAVVPSEAPEYFENYPTFAEWCARHA
jgi:RNA polymerase sigma factor (sigma-70 family)